MVEATAVKTRQYEGMFILDANLAGKHWDKAKAQLQELLENHGVELIRMEKWEERKLIYEINKHKRGVYVLAFFKSPPETITILKKTCRMTEWILRELILVHSGEVTDEMFRKPRAREREREESRRSGRDGKGRRGPKPEKREAPKAEATAPAAEKAPAEAVEKASGEAVEKAPNEADEKASVEGEAKGEGGAAAEEEGEKPAEGAQDPKPAEGSSPAES